jgi:hypothetical protein
MPRSKQVQQLETVGNTLILVAHRYEKMEKALQDIHKRSQAVHGETSWSGALYDIMAMAKGALADDKPKVTNPV